MSGTCPIIPLTHGLQKQPHKSRKELIELNESEKKQVALLSEELLCYRNHHKINRGFRLQLKARGVVKKMSEKNMTIFVN